MAQTREKEVDVELLMREYKDKSRDRIPKALIEHLDDLSWDAVANLADEFRVKTLKDTSELRAVQKELELTRMILLDKLRATAGKEGVALDASFLKQLIGLLKRSYEISIRYEVDADSFMVLISLIIEKMKKEKLVVYDSKGRTFMSVKKMRPTIREDMFSYPIEENNLKKGLKGVKGGSNRKGKKK